MANVTIVKPGFGAGISRRTRWRLLRGRSIELLSLVGGLAIWELMGWALGQPWLPPFSRVLRALADMIASGAILGNLLSSLQMLAIGLAISLALGLSIGALMGYYRGVEETIDVFVHALLIAPTMALAPIFFVLFGLTDSTRVALIIVYALPIIIINTSTGVRASDERLMEMARSFGANDFQIIRRILLPASLPIMFAGIRLGVGRGVKGMINGEMLIALVGLGALAQKFGGQFDTVKVLAVALVVLVVALVADGIVDFLESRYTAWVG